MRKLMLLLVVVMLIASIGIAMAEPGPGLNRGAGSWTTTYSQQTGGAGSWSAIYDGVSATGKGWKNAVTDGDQSNLKVSADVELFAIQTWDATGVYFHKADMNTPAPVYLNGTMTSNHGEWIGLATDPGVGKTVNIYQLERVADYRGTALTTPDNPIRLDWRMADNAGSGWSDWKGAESIDTPGADNTIATAVWWQLGNATPGSHAGAPGSFQYSFRCTPAMAPLQEAGRYELDPIVIVMPEL